MRATGMPSWMVWMTVSTAPSMRIEGAHRGGHGFGNAVKAQRDFGDDAERAFGADEQARQVIAGRGFARAARGADDAAVGEHHRQRKHVLAHGAVAHRVGAGRARRGHAAEGGVGARIDREEQALVADEGVQFLARHARLHGDVEVFRADAQDLVHVASGRRLRRHDAESRCLRARCRCRKRPPACVCRRRSARSPRLLRWCSGTPPHRDDAGGARTRPCRGGRAPRCWWRGGRRIARAVRRSRSGRFSAAATVIVVSSFAAPCMGLHL